MRHAGDPESAPVGEDLSDRPIVRVLGMSEAVRNGHIQGKALVLLSYLSLNGPQSRRRIAVLFWPHATDPLNRVSVALARIRGLRKDAIAADRQRVWTELVTDAALVGQALDGGRIDEALAHYRGAFLADAYPRDVSEELEEWIAATRDGLARRIQLVRLEAALALARRGRFAEASVEADAAITAGGTALLDRDELARLHLLLLAGEHPAAHAVGHDAKTLGIAVATTRAEARARLIRIQESPPTPSNLSSPATTFVGRDAERLALVRLIALPDRRLITLTGPGGTGKTRLALRVAADQLETQRYPDGVFFVALEDAPTAAAIPTTIAEALGITVALDRPPVDALAATICDCRMLLVLDNLEHLAGAGAVVDGILTRCSHLTLLVTSHDRLAIDAEWLFPVDGLDIPAHDPDPTDAHAWSALALFEQRAQRVQPTFLLTRHTVPHVAAICRLVHGNPLAIELAAAHVAIMPVAEIAAEVRTSLDVLVSATRQAAERHHSLRVVFEHTWRRLDDEAREVLRRLSVFHGGFDREAARTVAGATLSILTALVTQALVVRRHDRFELHPLVHQYAQEKLAADPPAELEAQRRHATWSLDLALAAFARRNTAEGGRWLDRLEAEHANLRAALRWAEAASEIAILAPLTNHLVTFWIRRGHHAEALLWFETLRRHLPALDPVDAAITLRSNAFVATLSGVFDLAGDLLASSLAIAREDGNAGLEALARSHLGILAVYRGRYTEAVPHYAAALDIAVALRDRDTIARLQNNLGDVARFRGELEEARRHYEASLAAERALGDRQMVSNVLGSFSQVALAEGHVSEARAQLRESIELLRELGITFSFPVAFDQVATLAASTGRPLDAARLWGAAEALSERLRIPSEPFLRSHHQACVTLARAASGGAAFDAAWREGRRLSATDAIVLALTIC